MTRGTVADAGTADAFELVRTLGGGQPDTSRHDDLADGLERLGHGTPATIGTSSLVAHSRTDAPMQIAVVGRHDRGRLATMQQRTPQGQPLADAAAGAGVASQFGPLLAFARGAQQAANGQRVAITTVSVGPDDDIMSIVDDADIDTPDLIVCTEAVAWSPELPTLTTGCRGRLVAEISVTASAGFNDHVFAGVSLNPLQRLVDVLASLRGDGGRISLPGFYERAVAPDRTLLDGVGTDDWFDLLGGARPGGRLSAVQRASQWPVFSVLDVTSESIGGSTPHKATAVVSFSFVPNQRPVDIERSLRAAVGESIPDTLAGSVRVLQSTRPWAVATDDPACADLARALERVHGSKPKPVPAGGMAGSGELHYRYNVPVLNVGLAGPEQHWGSTDEVLPRSLFEAGVEVAGEVVRGSIRRHAR